MSKLPSKIVLLNALVPPSNSAIMLVYKVSLAKAREIVKDREIDSYIGHPSTAKLLTKRLGVTVLSNRGMYTPRKGDVALVFRLKRRLASPADIENVTEDDIVVYFVHYAKAN